jgi:hypothetical protein
VTTQFRPSSVGGRLVGLPSDFRQIRVAADAIFRTGQVRVYRGPLVGIGATTQSALKNRCGSTLRTWRFSVRSIRTDSTTSCGSTWEPYLRFGLTRFAFAHEHILKLGMIPTDCPPYLGIFVGVDQPKLPGKIEHGAGNV